MSESLSEKIAGILSAAPVIFDPEDDVHEETVARVETGTVDEGSEDEQILSTFRKQNIDLLEDVDKRYVGKKSSRKKILELDDWESSSEDKAEENQQISKGSESNSAVGSENDSDTENESIDENEASEKASKSDSDSDNEEENNEIDEDADSSEDDTNFKHLESSDTYNQMRKGICVHQQLSTWEKLLEIRIQFQKCLVTANKLPQTSTFSDIKQNCETQFTSKVAESKGCLTSLLDKLLYLQLLLLRKYPETKNLLSGSNENTKSKIESDEEIASDTEDELLEESNIDLDEEDLIPRKKLKMGDYSSEIDKRSELYKDYRNCVIQKWNDKTKIATNKSGNLTHSVVNQIEHILSDKNKLIKRTQLKRTDFEIVGATSNKDDQSSEEYNVDIFDDTDFYHHLLRELIEFKSADLTDPVQLGRQWIQLQNLRSKMKRKIDTKATKGRKIRYVVHSKLVNFMAPINESSWQDEAKSELFSSLFGKNQPVNTI